MSRYYLAGKMTGLPGYGYDIFETAAKALRNMGMEIVSPHEIDHGETEETRGSKPYHEYIAKGLAKLADCTAIILMENWSDSKGAKIEMKAALANDMQVWYLRNIGENDMELIQVQ